ncbi:hypothetical protein KAZ82_02175, partial [Candidatus Babeliales bacterium]|nr:hypothetical protein [Candidatus Babeliales bacterium]
YSAVEYFVNSEHKIRITHPEISNLTSNDDENNLQKLTKLLRNACLERPGLGEKIIAPRDYFNNTCSQVCIAIAGVLSAYLTYQLFVNYKNLNQQANAQMQCNVYQKLLDYVIQL